MNAEITDLVSWLGTLPRHPAQTHGLNESDAEVVRLSSSLWLATTIDSVAEEIAPGQRIYRDPFAIGWIAAMASLSDLAAVGAEPVGALLAAEWGPGLDGADRAEVARGFASALAESGTFLLGGDTGRTRSPVLAVTAVGTCDTPPLSRVGLREGHVLAATGRFGVGPALGLRIIQGRHEAEFAEEQYRPRARLREGIALRKGSKAGAVASACMDTSDGLVSTLDTLSLVNGGLGFELDFSSPEAWLEPAAVAYARTLDCAPFGLACSELGDYQLVFGFDPARRDEAHAAVPGMIELGRVVAGGRKATRVRTASGEKAHLDLGEPRRILNNPERAWPVRLAGLGAYLLARGLGA